MFSCFSFSFFSLSHQTNVFLITYPVFIVFMVSIHLFMPRRTILGSLGPTASRSSPFQRKQLGPKPTTEKNESWKIFLCPSFFHHVFGNFMNLCIPTNIHLSSAPRTVRMPSRAGTKRVAWEKLGGTWVLIRLFAGLICIYFIWFYVILIYFVCVGIQNVNFHIFHPTSLIRRVAMRRPCPPSLSLKPCAGKQLR